MRLSLNQNGERIRRDFRDISGARFTDKPGLPAFRVVLALDNVSLGGNTNLVLHGVRSSCCRRLSIFQREDASLMESPPEACVALCFACQIAAAMAATLLAAFSSASSFDFLASETVASGPGRRNNSSSHRM